MDQRSLLNFHGSRKEIFSAFEPFVHRHYQIRWKRRVFNLGARSSVIFLSQKMLSGSQPSFGGSQPTVKATYESFWGNGTQ